MRTLLRVVLGLLLAGSAAAQSVPVVMLSDLHFDPLRDPGKAARLASAPVAAWKKILEEPPTPTQPTDFAAQQKKCGARGVDSDFALVLASLAQARLQAPHAAFVTVTGDLLVHAFECRYHEALHTDEGYATFAEKTTSFVLEQVESEFPGVPVYVALGNNDSGCGDYSMHLHGRYFKATSGAVLSGLRNASPAERARARQTYEEGGYLAVTPPGMPNTRLLLLDDIFFSKRFSPCGESGKDGAGERAVLGWLEAELAEAKAHARPVWVLAHIPPGVNVYSTVTRSRDVCGGQEPEMFLTDDALGSTLAKYAGTVQLAVFGHTHADEMRLLGKVPAKLVGSVTPLNGNLPTFTLASVDARSARLLDYTVFVAPDKTGAGTWTREYSFNDTFGQNGFTGQALTAIFSDFGADPSAQSSRSKAYIQDFFPGGVSPLQLVWPQDVCALAEYTAEGYRRCTCNPKP